MAEFIIGVDLGGTRIRAARLDFDLNILQREETLTHAQEGPDAVIQRMVDLVRKVLPEDKSRVEGIGVSSPGPLNPQTGVVTSTPNLPGWVNVPLVQRLEDALGLKVYLNNDANVAVLAEASRGVAKGYAHAIYITLSTGIGGGVVTHGMLLQGRNGFAAELGQLMMVVDDQPSTLEQEAAGLALARQARERIESGAQSMMVDMVAGDIARIDSKIVGRAAKDGDSLALEIVRRAGWVIGLGIVSLLHTFNPEIIVIGGGVSNLGDLLFEPMHAAVKANIQDAGYLDGVRFESPALGEDVSIVGAAALVLTHGGVDSLLE